MMTSMNKIDSSDDNDITINCDICGMWVTQTKHECDSTIPVNISFPLDKNELNRIFDAEQMLSNHDIMFDTGTGFGHRDWQMEMLGPRERQEACKLATERGLSWEIECQCESVKASDKGLKETLKHYQNEISGGE